MTTLGYTDETRAGTDPAEVIVEELGDVITLTLGSGDLTFDGEAQLAKNMCGCICGG